MTSVPTEPLVLVVDDFEDSREMSMEFLSYSGFRVAEAKDGLEAVAKAIELQPDVILMDYSLPGIDGWEATRRIRASGTAKTIHIVGLTGYGEAEELDRAKAAGCDAFITKPCPPDKLVAEIQKLVKR